jgi:hypothetical protein
VTLAAKLTLLLFLLVSSLTGRISRKSDPNDHSWWQSGSHAKSEKRAPDLQRSRYIGQEKTHLQHIATAAALNLVRCLAWFNGVPRAQTRRSAFVRLYDVV